MQVLYAYYLNSDGSIAKSEKELFFSINKSYDLYHYLFLLLLDINEYAQKRLELGKQKRMPTPEDLNPNTKFIDNRILKQVAENEGFCNYIRANKMSWINNPELIKKLYTTIVESSEYKAYMEKSEDSYEADKEILLDIIEYYIAPNELLDQILEEQSIFWNDDLEFVASMVIKTITRMRDASPYAKIFMSEFKNQEDRDFIKDLFRKTILQKEENEKLIEEHISNWDVDRIAFSDMVLMQLAVTELLDFPTIPTKVTLNEYIEIAKFYSTNKSSNFINGVLDRIVEKLRKENKINKEGRGLIGEAI